MPSRFITAIAPGAVASPFSPDSISGLKTWLIADDLDASFNDGDSLNGQTWSSHAPAANNFAMSGTLGPVFKTSIKNGHDVVRFDGAAANHMGDGGDDSASFPSAATLFYVAAPNSDTQFGIYTDGANDAWDDFGGDAYVGPFKTTRTLHAGVGVPSTGWHYVTYNSGASAYVYRLDGVQQSSDAANFAVGTAHKIGRQSTGAGWFSGDIAEILVYDTALSGANVTSVEAYLVSKYGLP